MTVHPLSLRRRKAPALPAAQQPQDASDLGGNVYELATARRSHAGRIPIETLDEIAAAARLYEELKAEGREIRFDADRADGRVVAEIHDGTGNVHPISLTRAVNLSLRPEDSAA